eukprot:CAMPEP_0184327326 /NCGR_PEP_ID=MMETSP1049-20130417/143038_1 /TAXON_ID=77928 /ORGANISM="Proteomonas sulcata, Strain CCMP704" /LENGTH=403 /DNA_ID=CAMNT_0026649581 /DNA_START=28 /DNA_END=1238 /DNA_ORIENTATION=-
MKRSATTNATQALRAGLLAVLLLAQFDCSCSFTPAGVWRPSLFQGHAVLSGRRTANRLPLRGANPGDVCGPKMNLESPIAGASVSDDGFVVFLSSSGVGGGPQGGDLLQGIDMATSSLLPLDALQREYGDIEDVVKSPEALTILQLLQGIDMATSSLLPLDALQREYGDIESVLLTEVHLYPPAFPDGTHDDRESEPVHTSNDLQISEEQNVQRESAMRKRAPDLVRALKSVNVVLSESRAVDLLRIHSSVDGDLDSKSFSKVVAAARIPANQKPLNTLPSFALSAVTGESVGREVNVSSFVGLGLHLRHQAPVIAKSCRQHCGEAEPMDIWRSHAFLASDVGTKYPQWRSIAEINEEGAAMERRRLQLFHEAQKELDQEDSISDYQTPDFLKRIEDENEQDS